MLNIQEVVSNVLTTTTILLLTIIILLQLAFASYYNNDIYDQWNTIEEFEHVSSLRKFLLDKDWINDNVRLDELDYILVLTQQCSSEFFTTVPTPLVLAVISIESGFRSTLLGFSNDTGLMQIIPGFHRERIAKYIYNENVDLFDPRVNVMVGMDYLSELLEKFHGDIYTTLMAYNMGPDRARRYASNGWSSAYADVVMDRMNEISIFLEGR